MGGNEPPRANVQGVSIWMYLVIAVAILVILNVVFMLLAYLNNLPRRDKHRLR